ARGRKHLPFRRPCGSTLQQELLPRRGRMGAAPRPWSGPILLRRRSLLTPLRRRNLEPRDGSLNSGSRCLKVVDTFRGSEWLVRLVEGHTFVDGVMQD